MGLGLFGNCSFNDFHRGWTVEMPINPDKDNPFSINASYDPAIGKSYTAEMRGHTTESHIEKRPKFKWYWIFTPWKFLCVKKVMVIDNFVIDSMDIIK